LAANTLATRNFLPVAGAAFGVVDAHPVSRTLSWEPAATEAAARCRYNLPVQAAALLASIVRVFRIAFVQPHTLVRVLRTVINTLHPTRRIRSRLDHL
jgi:hypothetical protein